MKRTLVSLAATLSLVLAFGASARGIDVDKVNGSIHIESDQQAGDLSSVNGSIRVDTGGSATKVSTVNGGVELGDPREDQQEDRLRSRHELSSGGEIGAPMLADASRTGY